MVQLEPSHNIRLDDRYSKAWTSKHHCLLSPLHFYTSIKFIKLTKAWHTPCGFNYMHMACVFYTSIAHKQFHASNGDWRPIAHMFRIRLYNKLECAQRVHISVKLHCLRPDRNFRFHLCLENRIAYLYICTVIVAMTTQRYNLASRNCLMLLRRSQNIGNGVTFFYISPQPPL